MKLTILLEDYTIKGLELDVEFLPEFKNDEIWDFWGDVIGYTDDYLDNVDIESVELNGKELSLSDRNVYRISEYIKNNYEDEVRSEL